MRLLKKDRGNISLTPEACLSAIQSSIEDAKSSEELIELLLRMNSKEERSEIMKQNRHKIDSSFINKVLSEANEYCHYSEAFKKEKQLIELALELSDFTGDKKSRGKSLLFYTVIDFIEIKNKNLPLINEALKLFKETGDKKGEASCYAYKGSILVTFGKHKEGIDDIEKSMKLYKELGDNKEIVNILITLGNVYTTLEEKDRGIEYYNRGLKLCEANNYLMKQALIYKTIASSRGNMGQIEEAFHYLEKGESIVNSVSDEEIQKEKDAREFYYPNKIDMDRNYDRHMVLIESYREKGILYIKFGKYEKALKIYQIELELAENKNYKDREIIALWDIGNIYERLGKKEKALEYYKKSLLIEGGNMPETLKSFNYYFLAGYYLQEFDDLTSSLKCYREGIKHAQKIEMRVYSELLEGIGIRLTGEAYLEKDDIFLAEENFKKSLQIFELAQKEYGLQNNNLARLYIDMGKVYLKKRDFLRSFENYGKAMEYTDFLPQDRTACYLALGELYDTEGNYEKAIENYNNALKINSLINSPDRAGKDLLLIAKIYEKEKKYDKACEYYKSSVDIIENMRHEIKVEDLKRDFMKDRIEAYDRLISLLIKTKKDREAFNYSERARNRAFLDILSNRKVDFHHGVSEKLRKKEEELTEKIQLLNSRLGQERQKPEKEQRLSLIEKTFYELKKAKEDYEALLEQLKLDSPEYASFISVSPCKPETIQNLLDEKTVLMEYFIGKEQSYLWVMSKKGIHTYILPVKSENLIKKVKDYRNEISEDMTVEKIKSEEWKDRSAGLYLLLIKEAENLLKDKSRIAIVPDGVLNYLPFQTLMDDRGKLLIEKYEILYLPSGSVLKYCKEKNRLKKDNLLAFSLGDLIVPGYSPLPSTEEEVKNISPYFKTSRIYSEGDMTGEKICKESGNCDILHIATHSVLDPEAPMFSSLILADGPFEVYRVFDMNLSASLVTLSACSTAMGKLVAGDELIGLSRAFIYAGTPSVCVSLWDVSDVSTSALMERFYFHLRDKNKTEALRLAQMDTMKQYGHPFFWAPFILIGDWQ